jgi:YYY domain-containing protein
MEYGLVLVWALAYLGLALAALPLAAALFPRFPDRGAAFSLPVALSVLGVVGYLVGHLAFGWPALAAGLVVLFAASWLAVSRLDVEVEYRRVLGPGVVFLAGFALVVAIRAVDPGVQPLGGEKFLDFGLLRTLLRSPTLPPEDMWFAGEPVQYYYGGQMLAALLAELTFTPARYAYNLALAGFYAALVTAAYGLAGAVADAYGVSHRLGGTLGAFFAGLAANLYTAGLVLVWALPDFVVGLLPVPAELTGWRPREFFYWSASRVMSSAPGDPDAFNLITEFPVFAWLNGDLHAHMTSTPFMLLVAALAFAYWRTPAGELTRRRLLVFGAIPPVVGLIAVVNTWSFPSAVGVTWLALTFAPADPLSMLPPRFGERLPTPTRADGGETPVTALSGFLRSELARTGGALALAAVPLLLGVVWSLPFWLGTASGRSVGVVPAANRSALGGLLLVHGAFVLVFALFLAGRGMRETEKPYTVLATALLFGAAAWLAGFAAVGLLGPLMAAGWYLLRAREDVGYETALMIGGIGIVLLVEFLFVVEEAGPGRLNTVFKTYAQVWVLWSVAAGAMLARLTGFGRGRSATDDALPLDSARRRQLGAVLAALLVVSTGLYAGFALSNHFTRGSSTANQFGPTLDATAFVGIEHPAESEAIAWVDGLSGQPNIVTAAPAGYRWSPEQGNGASAASSLTGVPTVAGWYHERGYRGGEVYAARVADVETIYTGSDAAQSELLAEYDVEYVYVGPAERARYGSITVTDHPALSVAAEFESVTIYRVERSALPGDGEDATVGR